MLKQIIDIEIQRLLESKQVGIIYHYTNLSSLLNILKDFKLKDKLYNRNYISFSRNGNGIKGQGSAFARIVLNGNKMSNKYSIIPYSQAMSNGKLAPYKSHKKKQAEERIYKTEVFIKPYILAIEIIKDYANDDMTKEEKQKVEKLIYPKPLNIVDKWSKFKQ